MEEILLTDQEIIDISNEIMKDNEEIYKKLT